MTHPESDPMDDRQALMAAIIANPDEDTPRLALADWLDEHGDEHDKARADLIRLQCGITVPLKTGERTRKLEKRLAAISHRLEETWLSPLDAFQTSRQYPLFTRGIYSQWHTTAGNFLKKPHQQVVREWFPKLGVEELFLQESSKRAKAVVDSPALEWVVEFCWYNAKLEDDGFTALAESPRLARLSRLIIDKPRCTDAGLRTLAKSKVFPNLQLLGLWDGLWKGDYSHIGVLRVLNSSRFPKLQSLDLSGAQSHAVRWKPFFADEGLSRLRVLRTGFQTDIAALAACKHLTNLEELTVDDSEMTAANAQTFTDNPAFAKLKKVAFRDINPQRPRLPESSVERLRDRFGDGLDFEHSIIAHAE